MVKEVQFEKSPNFVEKRVGDEMILVPLSQQVAQMSEVFTLNDVGAFIWDLIAIPHTLEQLVQQVVDHFEVASQIAQNDIVAFLDQAMAKNIVKEIKPDINR